LLVFANEMGGWQRPNRIDCNFKNMLRKANLPNIRFHDLRHTVATLLLGRGVHTKIVSEMLGHASVAMTLNVYSHVTSNMQQHAAGMLEQVQLGGIRPTVVNPS
jgi:integrase